MPFNLGSELELQKTLGSDIGDMQGSLGLLEKINNKSRNKSKSRNRLAQYNASYKRFPNEHAYLCVTAGYNGE